MFKRLLLPFIFLLFAFSSSSYGLSYQEIREAYTSSYTLEKRGDYQGAIKALMPVYQAYPNGYTVNLRLGWLYYLLKKYSNSEYHYQKALKAIPSSVEALLGLTLPYMAQERWEDVEKTCYRILRSDYYNYYGNLRLCLALRKLGNFSLSESVSRKMLSLYPTDVNFLLELALSLFFQKKYSYSEAVLKDVLILDPENPTAKLYLEKLEALTKGKDRP